MGPLQNKSSFRHVTSLDGRTYTYILFIYIYIVSLIKEFLRSPDTYFFDWNSKNVSNLTATCSFFWGQVSRFSNRNPPNKKNVRLFSLTKPHSSHVNRIVPRITSGTSKATWLSKFAVSCVHAFGDVLRQGNKKCHIDPDYARRPTKKI